MVRKCRAALKSIFDSPVPMCYHIDYDVFRLLAAAGEASSESRVAQALEGSIESANDLFHLRTLRRVILYHLIDERFHEIKLQIFLETKT